MLAAIYLRQSLDRDGTMMAVARQKTPCVELCDARGWPYRIYTDNDFSATRGRRPDYERMIKDVEAGEINAIVALDLDRLYRLPKDLEYLIDLAEKQGLLLATITGDADLGTDNGRLFARIKAAVAKAETERAAARRMLAAKQRAESGTHWGSRRPFGYTKDLEPHPVEAPLVQAAYDAVLARVALLAIAKEWTAQGIRTSLGNTWDGNKVGVMLRNPRYAGLRTYRGEIVGQGQWPALVSRELWDAAQVVLNDPARKTHKGPRVRKHLLTGLALCGKCGARVGTGVTHWGAAIYICRECSGIGRSMRDLDELVLSLVAARLSQEDASDLLLAEDKPDTAALQTEAAAIRAKLDALATDYAEDIITSAQLRAGSELLRGKLKDIEGRLLDSTKARLFDGVIGVEDVAAQLKNLDLSRRRAIIQALMVVTINTTTKGRTFYPEDVAVRWLE